MDRYTAEVLVGPTASFGEGPLWDDRSGLLWWTDIPASEVHCYDGRTGQDRTIPVAQNVGALALRRSGGVVVAARDGFAVLHADGSLQQLAAVNPDDAEMRMNDGKVDSSGRFYASTMTFSGEQARGELVRLDADLTTYVQEQGLRIGNGLDWTDDGRTMYFTDTPESAIDAFAVDVATGDLSGRQRLFAVDGQHGQPDGLCLDAEGALWVAMWNGSAVRRYAPDGELLGVVDLPVTNVTCPSFGGPDLDTLFITTAQPRFSGGTADEPLGGAVFALKPGVKGRPPALFAG